MKKLLLCAMALFTIGCSNDDSNSSSSTDCDCGRVVRCSSFTMVNPVGSATPTTTFTTFVVLNNCSNLEQTYNVNGNQTAVHPVGSQYCR